MSRRGRLAFLIKASVAALKKFPEFNSSIEGDQLVLKQWKKKNNRDRTVIN